MKYIPIKENICSWRLNCGVPGGFWCQLLLLYAIAWPASVNREQISPSLAQMILPNQEMKSLPANNQTVKYMYYFRKLSAIAENNFWIHLSEIVHLLHCLVIFLQTFPYVPQQKIWTFMGVGHPQGPLRKSRLESHDFYDHWCINISNIWNTLNLKS